MGNCLSEKSNEAFSKENNLLESDGNFIEMYPQRAYSNWSHQIKSMPYITFVPYTKTGICNIVKWARKSHLQVRACGYRHTFSELHPDSVNHIVISMLPLKNVETLPSEEIEIDPRNELMGIEILRETHSGKKALVKIGASVTNSQFRIWAVANTRAGKKSFTVPINTIMIENTFAGTISLCCHGSGRNHQTLSDLVREIEFVNVNGEIQTVNDPEEIKAAAGCFGLLGIVTSLTLELDEMTYANFAPHAESLGMAIPPFPDPKLLHLPEKLYDEIFGEISEEQLATATKEFYHKCDDHYYAEWFWFVFTDKCFVNVWNNDGSREKITYEYPSILETKLEEITSFVSQEISPIMGILPHNIETILTGNFGFDSIVQGTAQASTPLINALHFRRGIQNARVKNTEVIIPIPEKNGKPDWSICQRAWWDAIVAIYEYKNKYNRYPVNIALEMRLLGDSNMFLAPERANAFGSISIEVVTFAYTEETEWREFTQYLTDKWSSYKDHNGKPINVRPHWAKQWDHLNINNMSMSDYYRDQYKKDLDEFKNQMEKIAASSNYKFSDLQLFSNSTLDKLIFAA
ncbi:MAG: hypothetical protein Hyperionvirus5_119 [Hyperionvirus sp.]|uniref:FAD-binding PCMH-type domain-containing protein n=1 Tax=Hyperionvirus sp. TaxID=2487770 RepID=A0A3G5ABR0_9VIRU|nr:MAG: hypothetical protein Hyperionvirus5_119 [Hyperionvirus sp.]